MQDRPHALRIDREFDRIVVAAAAAAFRRARVCSNFSGSSVTYPFSTAADAAIAAAMMFAWVCQTLGSRLDDVGAELVEPGKPTTRTTSPPRFSVTIRRVREEEKRASILRLSQRVRRRQRDFLQRALR